MNDVRSVYQYWVHLVKSWNSMDNGKSKTRYERLMTGALEPNVASSLKGITQHFDVVQSAEPPSTPSAAHFSHNLVSSCLGQMRRDVQTKCSNSENQVQRSTVPVPFLKERKRGRPKGTYKLPFSLKFFAKNLPYAQYENLKPRHIQILDLHLQGLSRKSIADQVGVSLPTITNIVRSESGINFIGRKFKEAEADMSVLLKPAVEVYRKVLTGKDEDGQTLNIEDKLQLKAAESFIKTWMGKGQGVSRVEVTGKDGGAIAHEVREISAMKSEILKLAGVDKEKAFEATYEVIK